MSGPLLVVAAKGAHNEYTDVNPKVTLWRGTYKKHTMFSVEPVQLDFNGTAEFGRTLTAQFQRNGDLVEKMYIAVHLNPLKLLAGSGKVYWTNALGHAMIEQIDIEIGGSLIDRHYGDWLNICEEVDAPYGGELQETILKSGAESLLEEWALADSGQQMFIPLKFWFNQDEQALPMIALQFHEVRVKLKFRPKDHLVKTTGTAVFDPASGSIREAYILANYVYLDTIERRQFAQTPHEYLIEVLNFTNADQISSTTNQHTVQLNWNHIVKVLYFVIQRATKVQTGSVNTASGNAWFDYSFGPDDDEDPLVAAKLSLNSHDHSQFMGPRWWRQVVPLAHWNKAPATFIYVMSFCRKPTNWRPSGGINFSRIDKAFLIVQTQPITGEIRVYGKALNVLRVRQGMAGLKFAA